MIKTTRVENGLLRGTPAADPRIIAYKGVPFAAPPVGKNRWRAPQPAQDWEGVLECLEFKPISMQAKTVIDVKNVYTREWSVDPDIVMDEDCLYLNIWTPAATPEEKLPVFVWYFGGGLQVGHPSEMEFDGERIARRGVVVVSVNYRLNAFGFLCHPEITAEAPEAPANFGNLDQQFGTQWVKRNITAFGGDPDNITIGGQSAGGGSVMSQLTSPQNGGLFQKAIVESGIFNPLYPGARSPMGRRNLEDAEKEGEKFFEYLGVKSLEEARSIDAFTLRDKIVAYRGFWGTVVDNKFSTGNSFRMFLENKRWMCPVMLGHTSSEFFSAPNIDSADALQELAHSMFGEDAEQYLAFFDLEHDSVEDLKKKGAVSGIEYAIRIACEANARTGGKANLYYYNFDAQIPGWDNAGTFHSVDLWFFFETLAKCWRPFVGKHYDLARQMCNYWANFMKTGDPNGPDSTGEPMPEWKPLTAEAPYGMLFGDKAVYLEKEPSDLMKFLVKEYFKKNPLE